MKVKCKLTGEDGNAFAVMGRVVTALKQAGVTEEKISIYLEDAMMSNYENLILVSMTYLEMYNIDYE